MSGDHADVSKHVKLYMVVLGALLVGTILTVLASKVEMGGSMNLVVALLIAGVKATMVAAIFMHLKWEKSISIWWPLALCGFFFIVLLALPVLVANDLPPHVRMGSWG